MLQFPLNVTQKWVRKVYDKDVFLLFCRDSGFVQQVNQVDKKYAVSLYIFRHLLNALGSKTSIDIPNKLYIL